MVVESLLSPFKLEHKPWEAFFLGIAYSTIAIFLSLWIFESQASFVMVFLTVLAAVPIVYKTMKIEEDKDLEINEEKELLKEHSKAVAFLMFLFLGVTLSCVFWYSVLPQEKLNFVFEKQTKTIADINNQISAASIQQFNVFVQIIFNNIKVMSFAVLFSFIYGMGAIFILTWNATVIGTAIGNFIRSNLSSYADLLGFEKIGGYFQVISMGLLKYSIHGIPEILAYFYAGLAGGIISVAVMRHHFAKKKFAHIMFDASELLIIAIILVIIAGILEAYVTPALF